MKRTSLPIKLINKWGESRCFNLIRDKTKQDPPVDLTVSTRLEKFPESETKYGKEAGDKSRETCGRMKGSRVERRKRRIPWEMGKRERLATPSRKLRFSPNPSTTVPPFLTGLKEGRLSKIFFY